MTGSQPVRRPARRPTWRLQLDEDGVSRVAPTFSVVWVTGGLSRTSPVVTSTSALLPSGVAMRSVPPASR